MFHKGFHPTIGHYSLHEGVIDRDDESLASLLQLGVVDETRNMGAGARRALKNVSPEKKFLFPTKIE
jgi:hypothetical protein